MIRDFCPNGSRFAIFSTDPYPLDISTVVGSGSNFSSALPNGSGSRIVGCGVGGWSLSVLHPGELWKVGIAENWDRVDIKFAGYPAKVGY